LRNGLAPSRCGSSVILLCAFLVGPIVVFLAISVSEAAFASLPDQGMGLQWFRNLFASGAWSSAFMNRLLIGVCAALEL
jgi:ABC-type spermidine/putrescine transport system permease subunit II